jgi:hypothetical protein
MCPSSLKFKNYIFIANYFNLRPLPDTCQLSSLTQYLTSQADEDCISSSSNLLNYLQEMHDNKLLYYSLIIHKNCKVYLQAFLFHCCHTSL